MLAGDVLSVADHVGFDRRDLIDDVEQDCCEDQTEEGAGSVVEHTALGNVCDRVEDQHVCDDADDRAGECDEVVTAGVVIAVVAFEFICCTDRDLSLADEEVIDKQDAEDRAVEERCDGDHSADVIEQLAPDDHQACIDCEYPDDGREFDLRETGLQNDSPEIGTCALCSDVREDDQDQGDERPAGACDGSEHLGDIGAHRACHDEHGDTERAACDDEERSNNAVCTYGRPVPIACLMTEARGDGCTCAPGEAECQAGFDGDGVRETFGRCPVEEGGVRFIGHDAFHRNCCESDVADRDADSQQQRNDKAVRPLDGDRADDRDDRA